MCLALLGAVATLAPVRSAAELPETPGPEPPATDEGDAAELEPIADAQEVQPGAVVHLEFTLRSASGEILDSTQGRAPLVYTHGKGEIIAGLERALTGMRVGEEKEVTVAPEEAYGPLDPAAVTEVPTDRVPPEARAVGARLLGHTPSGREISVRVREIKEETILLDLNHPLAGQTLVFDVKIILVEPPAPDGPQE